MRIYKSLQLLIFTEEFLASASHQLVLIAASLLFVLTARSLQTSLFPLMCHPLVPARSFWQRLHHRRGGAGGLSFGHVCDGLHAHCTDALNEFAILLDFEKCSMICPVMGIDADRSLQLIIDLHRGIPI